MLVESQRSLLLPGTPDEVWKLLSDPARMSVLAPEIEDAWPIRGGQLRVVARLGRRRRAWRVKPALDEAAHRLALDSVTPGVGFHLEAVVEAAPEGARVKVNLRLEPPEIWKADPQPGGIPRRVAQRLLLSVVLFALTAFGVVELPSLALTGAPAAVAYALVGATFVVAAALLSGAHNPRTRGRRRFLPRLPKLGGGEAPKG